MKYHFLLGVKCFYGHILISTSPRAADDEVDLCLNMKLVALTIYNMGSCRLCLLSTESLVLKYSLRYK